MKFSNTIITLLVILFSSLLIGTFLGFKSQEGITYNKLTVLEEILTRDSDNKNKINIIKTLNIEDDEFINVIENNEYDDDRKISEINSLVEKLFKTNIYGETYEKAMSIDITNPK